MSLSPIASDADGDDVRCRWPANLDESGDIVLPPMNMVLDQVQLITHCNSMSHFAVNA